MVWRCFMIPFSALAFLGLFFYLPLFAQSPNFSKRQIVLGGKTLTVEISETPEQRQQGLMHRKVLEEDSGMLFIFDRPQQLSFWMKNTLIPLSIGFFDKDKKLLNVKQMHPPKSMLLQDHQLERYSSEGPAKYALEMNIGWFKSNKIKSGANFTWKTPNN